jgi:hypothetical protein
MAGKEPQATAKAAWGYDEVETALAAVFGVDAAGQSGWFRARIINLRRIGLSPASGRGQVIAYDFEWAAKWYLGLLLTVRLGRDPSVVVKFIKAKWDRPTGRKRQLSEAVDRGEATIRDLVKVAREVRRPDDHVILTIRHGAVSELPIVGYTAIAGMKSLGFWLAGRDDPGVPLLTIVDLTAALHRLDAALAGAAAKAERNVKASATRA